MFNKKNYKKNGYMLNGKFAKKGYDWWWHSFTGYHDGEKRRFFIEYFIINPEVSKDEVKYGSLGNIPSYVMVKCGSWGEDKLELNKFYRINDVKITKAPYMLEGPAFLASDNHISGAVSIIDSKDHPEYMSNDGYMEWDLNIKKDIAFNVGYGTSGLFRFLKAFEMYWHVEGMKSRFSGYVNYNGVKYEVNEETSNGYSDKNWGSNFTSPWVWISTNNIYDKIENKKLNNSAFDIGGGKPKVFNISLDRRLLSAFYIEGKEYEYNFSKFIHKTKTEFNCREESDKIIWDITQKCKKTKMVCHLECDKKDMLNINYESPDGFHRHNRLWNGGNGHGTVKIYDKSDKLIHDLEVTDCGCEYGEYN